MPRATRKQPNRQRVSLAEAATDLIRDRIVDLSLPPGAQLDEKTLTERFNLSRTPAREAINRLSAEGLVDFTSGRGAFVTDLSLHHVIDLMDAYVLAERMVAAMCRFDDPNLCSDLKNRQSDYEKVVSKRQYLAITEANSAFHARISRATGNPFVARYSARLHSLARRVSFFVYQREHADGIKMTRHAAQINQHHHEIIAAIGAANRHDLVDILTTHACLFRDRVSNLMSRVDVDAVSFELVRPATAPGRVANTKY